MTPAKSQALAVEFVAIISGMAPAIFARADLRLHQSIAARVQVISEQSATAASCREIEACLGILLNMWMDAPSFMGKPRNQVQTVLDMFEIAGSVCHAAGAAT